MTAQYLVYGLAVVGALALATGFLAHVLPEGSKAQRVCREAGVFFSGIYSVLSGGKQLPSGGSQ